MSESRERVISAALADIRQNGLSRKKASSIYGIPASTLHDRIHGSTTKKKSKIRAQRLSPAHERFLVDWILHEEATGRAPSRRQAVAFAQRVLIEFGDKKPIGGRWIDRFLARHPKLKAKKSTLLDSARARGSSRAAYEEFFRLLRQVVDVKKIKPCNITNMDEHGMQELNTISGTVIGNSLANRALVTSSSATTWVSIIEAGTAEGKRLTPVVIFTGASLQGQWFPPAEELQHQYPGWKFDHSITGWSNSQIAVKWFKEVYLPETQPISHQEWRLLVIDEHSSHVSTEFQYLAFRHNVQLLYLPPHTSHKTQPLDRSVFSPLKNYFRQATKALATFTATAPVNKQRFLACYQKASARGVCPRNLISGFRNTGIWPLNPGKILNDPEAIVEDNSLPAVPALALSPRQSTLSTPRKSQDIYRALEVLRQPIRPTDRTVRSLFTKIGGVVDDQAATVAALHARVAHLEAEAEAHKPRSRKKVQESGNDRFAHIEDIVEAEKSSQKPPKKRRVAKPKDPGPVVEQAEELIAQGLQQIREAEEM
jgi:hypothetical protein